MLLRLMLLFITLPIIEVYVLVKASKTWGGMNVFFTILFMAIIGISITRNQGKFLLGQVQAKVARGEVPAIEMLEGVMVFIGGLMFLIPGFVSDVVGVTMVVPGLRRLWSLYLLSRLKKMAAAPQGAGRGWQSPGGGFVFYSGNMGGGPTSPFRQKVDINQARDVSPRQIIDIQPESKKSEPS